MSIQAIQLRGAERTAQTVRQTQSAVAVSGAASANATATAERRNQDQVEVSDQARKLAAALGEPTVELQLSPAKLREMLVAAESAVAAPASE